MLREKLKSLRNSTGSFKARAAKDKLTDQLKEQEETIAELKKKEKNHKAEIEKQKTVVAQLQRYNSDLTA